MSDKKYIETLSDSQVLTLGSRFKRMTELILGQVQELYNHEGLKMKPVWFPILVILKDHKSLDIKTLSKMRKISHSAISQLVKELVENGLVNSEVEEMDQRQRKISLTKEGTAMINKIAPLLKNIEAKLLKHVGKDHEVFFKVLDNIEEGLRSESFLEVTLCKRS